MNRLRSLYLAAAWLITAAGAAFAQNAGDEVVAKLGNIEVRVSEVQKMLEGASREDIEQLMQSPQAMDRLVRTEIFRRALVAEARSRAWDARPEVILQMERAKEQALLASFINEISRPPADFPSEQDITTVYNANTAEFTVPRQFRVSQIFVAVPKDAKQPDQDRLKKKAEDIAKRVQAKDADFPRLAQANSDHKPSTDQGGDMGWLAERDMIPELRTVVPSMLKGDVAKPVRTEQGWHVIKLMDTKPQSVRPLAEVRPQLVKLMRQRRAQELEKKHMDEIAEKTPPAVNEIALIKLRSLLGKP